MNVVMKLCMFLLLGMLGMCFVLFGTSEDNVYAEVETGVDIGMKAAGFSLLTLDGKEIELESFAKGKITLLVFGTTWCPSCRHEISILKEYYNELKAEGLNVLGIDIQESAKKVKSLMDKKEVNYPVVLDSKAVAAKLYKVVGIPLNIVLDRNGVIEYKANELPDKELLKKLLQEK